MGKPSGIVEERINKAEKLRERGVNLYPAGSGVEFTARDILDRYEAVSAEELEEKTDRFSVAGRIMSGDLFSFLYYIRGLSKFKNPPGFSFVKTRAGAQFSK